MIRRFEPKDASAVLVLSRSSPGAAQWSEQSYIDLRASGFLGWVAELNNVIQGFLVARPLGGEAEILNCAVAPARRRTGIGSELLSTALRQLRDSGVSHVFLEVRESNAVAIAFYEKFGFARSGRRPDYYRYPNEAAVLMDRVLKS